MIPARLLQARGLLWRQFKESSVMCDVYDVQGIRRQPCLVIPARLLQARGLLWRQFKKSNVVYDALKVPFAKIDAGVFNLTEVGG